MELGTPRIKRNRACAKLDKLFFLNILLEFERSNTLENCLKYLSSVTKSDLYPVPF